MFLLIKGEVTYGEILEMQYHVDVCKYQLRWMNFNEHRPYLILSDRPRLPGSVKCEPREKVGEERGQPS